MKTQVLLQSKIDGLKIKRVEKDEALVKQSKEKQVLEIEKKEKDRGSGPVAKPRKRTEKRNEPETTAGSETGECDCCAIRRAREEAIREAKKKQL